jgi:type II secretory pathway component PulC
MSRSDLCAVRVGFTVVLLALSVSSLRAQDFVYDSKGKRNPFIPLVTADGRFQKLESEETRKDTELKLEGIIYDKYGISYAVVDGSVVRIGDSVGDYRVLKIEEKRVIFMREGQEVTVDLKKEGA